MTHISGPNKEWMFNIIQYSLYSVKYIVVMATSLTLIHSIVFYQLNTCVHYYHIVQGLTICRAVIVLHVFEQHVLVNRIHKLSLTTQTKIYLQFMF